MSAKVKNTAGYLLAILAFIIVVAGWLGFQNFFTVGDNYGRIWVSSSATDITAADGIVIKKSGSVITFADNTPKTFYADGPVTLINAQDYTRLCISPEGTFSIKASNDNRRITITSKSGEMEMTTIRASQILCDDNKKKVFADLDTEEETEMPPVPGEHLLK